MRNVLIAAAALVALAMPAEAAPKHKWFGVNYATGNCDLMPLTPEQFYTFANATHADTGTSVDRIAPENVDKDAAGNIHAHLTGAGASRAMKWDFFTLKADCDKFIKDEGITPGQAPSGDIN